MSEQWVLMDLDGDPVGHYSTREGARDALVRIQRDEGADVATELYVLVYDGNGEVLHDQSLRGDELLASHGR